MGVAHISLLRLIFVPHSLIHPTGCVAKQSLDLLGILHKHSKRHAQFWVLDLPLDPPDGGVESVFDLILQTAHLLGDLRPLIADFAPLVEQEGLLLNGPLLLSALRIESGIPSILHHFGSRTQIV